MPNPGPILELDDLRISLMVGGRPREIVLGVSFAVGGEESLGLVGESGSGKTMTIRSILRLLPVGAKVDGDIRFRGRSILAMSPPELRQLRGAEIGMIFQDPWAAINPVRTIGDFLTEGLVRCRGVDRQTANRRVIALLEQIGVARAGDRLGQFPHELSGGLLQRMMIASVVVMEPSVILADEPTTALDPTTQEDVMAVLEEQRRQRGMSLLLVSHNLELVSAISDRMLVMYAGLIVEDRQAHLLRNDPLHPYTAALAASRPLANERVRRLPAIPGQPISAADSPPGCAFAPRCPHAETACRDQRPPLRLVDGSRVACRRAEELRGHLTQRESPC